MRRSRAESPNGTSDSLRSDFRSPDAGYLRIEALFTITAGDDMRTVYNAIAGYLAIFVNRDKCS